METTRKAHRIDEQKRLNIPTSTALMFAEFLEYHFPWLETEESISGADVVDALKELYLSLLDQGQ